MVRKKTPSPPSPLSANGVSLRVAFYDLYEKEGATDASFTKYCEDAEEEAAAVAVAAAAAAEACIDDGSIVEEADPIILHIYPELVRFSTDQHVKGDFSKVGLICASGITKLCVVLINKECTRVYYGPLG